MPRCGQVFPYVADAGQDLGHAFPERARPIARVLRTLARTALAAAGALERRAEE